MATNAHFVLSTPPAEVSYHVDGDGTEALADLDRRVKSGAVPLPDWFGAIRFASVNCVAL